MLLGLCLQKYTEKLTLTTCCHTKIHSECTADLAALFSPLTYDHSPECGQLTDCNQLCWVHYIRNILLNGYIPLFEQFSRTVLYFYCAKLCCCKKLYNIHFQNTYFASLFNAMTSPHFRSSILITSDPQTDGIIEL